MKAPWQETSVALGQRGQSRKASKADAADAADAGAVEKKGGDQKVDKWIFNLIIW